MDLAADGLSEHVDLAADAQSNRQQVGGDPVDETSNAARTPACPCRGLQLESVSDINTLS